MYSHYKPEVLGFKKNSRKYSKSTRILDMQDSNINLIPSTTKLNSEQHDYKLTCILSLFFFNCYLLVRLSTSKFKIWQFFVKHNMGYDYQKSFSLPLKPLAKSIVRQFKLLSATSKASLKKSPKGWDVALLSQLKLSFICMDAYK